MSLATNAQLNTDYTNRFTVLWASVVKLMRNIPLFYKGKELNEYKTSS